MAIYATARVNKVARLNKYLFINKKYDVEIKNNVKNHIPGVSQNSVCETKNLSIKKSIPFSRIQSDLVVSL